MGAIVIAWSEVPENIRPPGFGGDEDWVVAPGDTSIGSQLLAEDIAEALAISEWAWQVDQQGKTVIVTCHA